MGWVSQESVLTAQQKQAGTEPTQFPIIDGQSTTDLKKKKWFEFKVVLDIKKLSGHFKQQLLKSVQTQSDTCYLIDLMGHW